MIRSAYSLDEAISHSGYQDLWRDIPTEVINHLDQALSTVDLDQQSDYHPDNLIINHLDVSTVEELIDKYDIENLPANTIDTLPWMKEQLGPRYTILAAWGKTLLVCDHVDEDKPRLLRLFGVQTLDLRHAPVRK